MKKYMLIVDNGPEFGAGRYILQSGEYEGVTTRDEMFTALTNFFDCQPQAPGRLRCAGCNHLIGVVLDGESLCCHAPVSEG